MGSLGFWLTVALVAFVCSMAIAAVSYRVTAAFSALGDRIRRQLARDAATFGEPTREQIEAGWLLAGDGTAAIEYVDLDTLLDADLEAVEISDEVRLFGNAAAYFDSAKFETEVLADIATIPVTWSFR